MLKPMRRITTGVDDEKNRSIIVSDEQVDVLTPYTQLPCFTLQNIFYTKDNLQSLETRHVDEPYEIQLPAGAMRFLKIRMPTITEIAADLKAAGQDIPQDWTQFNLHSTDSIDYIYVLSGKITCVVGKQQIQLKEGDFLAQVGPEHTWVNDNDQPCYFLAVMVGIRPSGNRKKMVVE